MLYAALSSSQRQQVRDLFCDEYFGKDPAWFDYCLDEQGHITTRQRMDKFYQPASRAKPRCALPVRLVEIVSARPITREMQMRYELAMQVVAKHLYRIIQQKGLPQ